MMTPRKGIRLRLGRRKKPRSAEAWAARREELGVRLRGAALESRRRLRPLAPLVETPLAMLGRIAPYISGALLFMVRVPAGLIALLLEAAQAILVWVRDRTVPVAIGVGRFLSVEVTPLRTTALVAAGAAVALGISQFFDYSGVGVGAPPYEGEVGSTAPVPLTGTESAGDAHLWLLLPVAILALVMTLATYRGQWRFGRIVGLLGLIGVAVSLIVDLPQGLDSGRAGVAYSGTDAQLIEGFWAQLAASAVLVLCGPLLGWHARRAGGEGRRERRGRRRSRRPLRSGAGASAESGAIAFRGGAGP